VRMRLATRLILGVVLIEAVMLTALVWNSVRLIESSHAELLERATREQTTLLAALVAPGLATQDRAAVLDALILLRDKRDLVYAVVRDRDGRPMASLGRPPPRLPPPDAGYEAARADGVFDVVRPVVLAGEPLGTLHAGYSIAHVEALTADTRLQNASIAAVELTLSIAATVLLGLLLTRGLRRLQRGAEALRRGELEHRIRLEGRDEIAEVARAFDAMADALQRTLRTLERERGELARSNRRYQALLQRIGAVLWEADPDTLCVRHVSGDVRSLLGVDPEAWLAPDFMDRHVHPEDAGRVRERLRSLPALGGVATLDYRMLRADGRCIWVRDIVAPERDAEGRHLLRGLRLDITESKRAEERLAFLADHDPLTGLLNRRRFQEELERHVALARRHGHEGALLYMDLDQFKYINDTFGHQSGDRFLLATARRLAQALRRSDVLGRLGGDEFGVILPETGVRDAVRVAEHLLAALREQQEEGAPRVGASIGIVVFPRHGERAGDLLARADMAMYAAKERGRNRWQVFDPEDPQLVRMHGRLHWETRLRRALAEDGFVLHFQPVYRLRPQRRICHYEVLLRLADGEGRLIPPAAFLDIAERFGLIGEIDLWVVDHALRRQAQWARAGRQVTLAINLSGRHLGSARMLDGIREALARHGADPARVIFEVTETAAVENMAQAQAFVLALKELGCRFALDDFGAGFSSFHYLRHLPVDHVKIDGAFVRRVRDDEVDRLFVRTIVQLATGLGIGTVAEFVEDDKTLAVLEALGVDLAQGYHLGRPAATLPGEPDTAELNGA